MTRRMFSFIAAALLGIAVAFPAFVSAQNYPASVKDLVANTRKQIKTIGMPAFKAVYDAKLSSALIVDVREPEEYAAGFVPGAVNVPRGLLEFTIWEHVGFPDKLDMAKPLFLYCKTGGRCTLAAKSLQDLGFTNVTAVVMLFEDWKKAGYPVETPKK
ncbi:MAG TPA: rhodanese-like domain-containing protein [Burkholderiaceae bacterium]|nr:rhodanese-like domain-containing protein [Burkholderiaceae bacterium]HQR70490.1 rhodanese-like domain-containing protein [Burkholderiaceae bacterium]